METVAFIGLFAVLVFAIAAGAKAVGVQMVADGGIPAIAPRQDKTSAAVITQAHGKYYEAASRGNLYAISTGATGEAPGTAASTTPPIYLYNPPGSGKRMSIKRVYATYVSGTLGAGSLFHALFTFNGPVATQSATAPTVSNALVPVNLDVGSSNNSVAVCSAAGTLHAAPSLVLPFATINAMLASTATNPADLTEDVDGAIVLEPGSGYAVNGLTAAGSSPLMAFGIVWEEIPIV